METTAIKCPKCKHDMMQKSENNLRVNFICKWCGNYMKQEKSIHEQISEMLESEK